MTFRIQKLGNIQCADCGHHTKFGDMHVCDIEDTEIEDIRGYNSFCPNFVSRSKKRARASGLGTGVDTANEFLTL